MAPGEKLGNSKKKCFLRKKFLGPLEKLSYWGLPPRPFYLIKNPENGGPKKTKTGPRVFLKNWEFLGGGKHSQNHLLAPNPCPPGSETPQPWFFGSPGKIKIAFIPQKPVTGLENPGFFFFFFGRPHS